MRNYKNGLETKQMIYQSARHLFIHKGFCETTLRDIADDTQIKLGLINYYFESKDTLGCIIHKDLTEQINQTAEKVFQLEEASDSEEALDYHVLSYMVYFEFYRQVPEAARLYCALCKAENFPATLIHELSYYTDSVIKLGKHDECHTDLENPVYFDILHSLLSGMEIQLMQDLISGRIVHPFHQAIDIYLNLYFRHIFRDTDRITRCIQNTRQKLEGLVCLFDENDHVIIKRQ